MLVTVLINALIVICVAYYAFKKGFIYGCNYVGRLINKKAGFEAVQVYNSEAEYEAAKAKQRDSNGNGDDVDRSGD